MHLTTFLIFELGSGCNLSSVHRMCPNGSPERYASLDTRRVLDDATICKCAKSAYLEHGFTGLIGWYYYNEPTLQAERMFTLMERIRGEIPEARFILWTNGTRFPAEPRLAWFEHVAVSDYFGLGEKWTPILRHFCPSSKIMPGRFDERLQGLGGPADGRCLRIFSEFILDNYGNHHPCCYDWCGQSSVGNVFTAGFPTLVARHAALREQVAAPLMRRDAPTACRCCGFRHRELWRFDPVIDARVESWLKAHE